VANPDSRYCLLIVLPDHRYGPQRQGPPPELARPRDLQRRGKNPLIDVGTIGLIRKGAIEVRPGVERFDGQDVVFVDGIRERYDAVVLATGYRPTVAALLERASLLTDEHGNPCRSGREVAQGLYFCGFHVSPTGMLREITREAKRIATDIAGEHAGGGQPHPLQLHLSNGELGIDLAGGTQDSFEVTANDTDDPDAPSSNNHRQNFPVITSATKSNTNPFLTTITGTLNSNPNQDFVIQCFVAAPDPSGHGPPATGTVRSRLHRI
jgi:hypothetical protein